MSEPFDTEAFARQIETLTGLGSEKAAAVSGLLDQQIFMRMAGKDDLVALNARITNLEQQINEGADTILKDLVERIADVPEKTRDALKKPLWEMHRSTYDHISKLQADFWIVLCIAIAVSAARAILS